MASKIAELLSKFSKQIPVQVREKLEKELIDYENSLQTVPEKPKKGFVSVEEMLAFTEYVGKNFSYCRDNVYIKYEGRVKMTSEEIKTEFFK